MFGTIQTTQAWMVIEKCIILNDSKQMCQLKALVLTTSAFDVANNLECLKCQSF